MGEAFAHGFEDKARGCGAWTQTDRLHALLGNEPIATGDLVLAEVLQGFGSAQDFNQGKKLLTSMPIIELVGGDIAIQAANNFRTLRSLGITVRKTIDTLIATSCIEKGLALLYSDKDSTLCRAPRTAIGDVGDLTRLSMPPSMTASTDPSGRSTCVSHQNDVTAVTTSRITTMTPTIPLGR